MPRSFPRLSPLLLRPRHGAAGCSHHNTLSKCLHCPQSRGERGSETTGARDDGSISGASGRLDRHMRIGHGPVSRIRLAVFAVARASGADVCMDNKTAYVHVESSSYKLLQNLDFFKLFLFHGTPRRRLFSLPLPIVPSVLRFAPFARPRSPRPPPQQRRTAANPPRRRAGRVCRVSTSLAALAAPRPVFPLAVLRGDVEEAVSCHPAGRPAWNNMWGPCCVVFAVFRLFPTCINKQRAGAASTERKK